MTVTPYDLVLYAAGIFALFMTPGPVWLAVSARALSGGFSAAWPLALGVVVGDVVWPLLAIVGASQIVSRFEYFEPILRLAAMVIFWIMGLSLILRADRAISADSRLTRPGMWAGFAAGVAAILGNPKAILFYMAILPGFFDLTRVTAPDIAAILLISFIIPLLGNLGLATLVDKARTRLTRPGTIAWINRASGAALIAVGCLLPFA